MLGSELSAGFVAVSVGSSPRPLPLPPPRPAADRRDERHLVPLPQLSFAVGIVLVHRIGQGQPLEIRGLCRQQFSEAGDGGALRHLHLQDLPAQGLADRSKTANGDLHARLAYDIHGAAARAERGTSPGHSGRIRTPHSSCRWQSRMAHWRPQERESMNAKQEPGNPDFLTSALLFLGVAAAILVPLYLAYPPVSS